MYVIVHQDNVTGETFRKTMSDPREAAQHLAAIRMFENLTLVDVQITLPADPHTPAEDMTITQPLGHRIGDPGE